MSITGVSQSAGQTAFNTTFQQRNDAMNSLDQALSSGDLTSAQSAFSALQSLAPQGGKAPGGSDSPFAKDMAAVSSALQSGDMATAQSAFATLKQDMAAHKGSHHHHGGSQGAQASGPTDASTTTTSASGVIDTSNGLDITA